MFPSRGPASSPARLRAALRTLFLAAATLTAVATPAALRGGEPAVPAPLAVREIEDAVRSSIAAPGLVAWLGVVVDASESGVRVLRAVPGSPAAQAGLRAGDLLRSLGNLPIASADDLDRALESFRPGDGVTVVARRGEGAVSPTARLAARRPADGLFRGPVFRLAVVPLRFADDGADAPQSAPEAIRRALFAVTGREGVGASVADYYAAQSLGRLRVEGSVLEPVVLPQARAAYAGRAMGADTGSAFQSAADLLRRRTGDDGLAAFDGIAFLYGGAPETRAGFALWPHRSLVAAGARRIPYYVQGTGGPSGLAIGIHCHEFGHLLGLTDAYGAGHRTGSGDFCLMAIGHRGGPADGEARPFSLCAHCKLRLGWLDATVVDPRVAQRIRLRAVQSGAGQCVVLPCDARCDEFLVLENRARRAFDAELPSDGLLVWHTGGAPTPGQSVYSQALDLIEAHGIDTFEASLVRTDEIAFPTARARDLTPDTTPRIVPASRTGFAVHLTDIVRGADGCVEFTVGVPRRVRQSPPASWAADRPDADGWVVRKDPVTGEAARFYVGPPEGAPARDESPRDVPGQERR